MNDGYFYCFAWVNSSYLRIDRHCHSDLTMGRRIDRRLSFLVCSRPGKLRLFFQILFLLVALCLFFSLASQLATSNTMTQNDLRFQALDMGRNTDAVQNVSSIRGQPTPRRVSPGACTCGSDPTDLWDSLEYSAMRRRRKELEEWERLHDHEIEPLVECRTSSPLRYPASGITVEPFDTVKLRRLRLDPDHNIVKESHSYTLTFVSEKSLGVLFVSNSTFLKGVDVSGNFTGNVKIQSKAVIPIQQVCQSVYYHSNLYDIDTRDRITVTLNNVSFTINVRIKRRPMPFLYDPGESHHVNDLVTVITKTFERYDAVNRLIKSVNKRYPGMTTIVADDSERPQRPSGKHVKHYTMPFAEGASAGRNLALSQVRTKYFLYVDDDFVFTRGTKLENFIGKFEDYFSKLDVVAGTFGDEEGNLLHGPDCHGCCRFQHSLGNQDGDCLLRLRDYWYRSLDTFPQCHFTDMTTMFFMARTSSVRRAGGFDPVYERLGHTEYFFDWMGKLRVASCYDVNIYHHRVENTKYNRYRSREINPKDQLNDVKHTLFKNNLNCFMLG